MGLLALLLQFAPAAINAGLQIAPLISDALNKVSPQDNTIEHFAAKALQYVPAAMSAGVAAGEIAGVLTQANADIQKMIAENRGPSPDEWNAQDARIKSLEDQLDAAGRAPGTGGTAG